MAGEALDLGSVEGARGPSDLAEVGRSGSLEGD
jgi:hypothetical protein